jgi:hypothetical protein
MDSFIGDGMLSEKAAPKRFGGRFRAPRDPDKDCRRRLFYVELFRTRLIILKDEYAGSVDGWRRPDPLRPDPWWTFDRHSLSETHIKGIIKKT